METRKYEVINEEDNCETFLTSNQIRAMRALAIFGVVTAHGSAVPSNFSFISNSISRFIQSIGSMGVGIFFFISGYLLAVGNSKTLEFSSFLKRKIRTIGIPWIISATLVYFYVFIRKGGDIKHFFLSVLGYGSSYWFLSVLFILMIINYFILRTKCWKIISCLMILLSIVSIIIRVGGGIPVNAFSVYLNIFNWSIFFSTGIMLSLIKKEYFENFLFLRWLFYFLTIAILCLVCIFGKTISYYVSYYIFYEIIVILSAVFFSAKLKKNNLILRLGDISFSIYLWHELPWAGLVSNLCNRIDIWSLVVIRPFIVLFFTSFELFIGYKIFKKLKLSNLYCRLTGYKD